MYLEQHETSIIREAMLGHFGLSQCDRQERLDRIYVELRGDSCESRIRDINECGSLT